MYLIGMPYVVLVAAHDIPAFTVFQKSHEVVFAAPARRIVPDDPDFVVSHPLTESVQDIHGPVAGTVVAHRQPPLGIGLILNGKELFFQIVFSVECGHHYIYDQHVIISISTDISP